MSENRVKISYSVEFTKVPEAVSDLVNKVYKADYQLLRADFEDLLIYLEERNEKSVIEKIVEIRKRLMNIDFCMSDSEDIISAYQKYLVEQIQEIDQKLKKLSYTHLKNN